MWPPTLPQNQTDFHVPQFLVPFQYLRRNAQGSDKRAPLTLLHTGCGSLTYSRFVQTMWYCTNATLYMLKSKGRCLKGRKPQWQAYQ